MTERDARELMELLRGQLAEAYGRLYVPGDALGAAATALLCPTSPDELARLLREHGLSCLPEPEGRWPDDDVLLRRARSEATIRAADEVETTESLDGQVGPTGEDEDILDAETPIASMGLSVRARNALLRGRILTVGDLRQRTDDELLSIPNIGHKTWLEIRAAIEETESPTEGPRSSEEARSRPAPAPVPATDLTDLASTAEAELPLEAEELLDRFLADAAEARQDAPLSRILGAALQGVPVEGLLILALRLEHTLEEVGRLFGVTRERVRQKEKHAAKLLLANARATAPELVEELRDRMRARLVSSDEVIDKFGARRVPAIELLVPILLRALGGKNPKAFLGRIAGFWTFDDDRVTAALNGLAPHLPLPDGRIPELLVDARLPPELPLVELLRQPGSPAVLHSEINVWVRPRSRNGDAVYLLLQKHGRPASTDAMAELLRMRPHALRETLRRDERFRRLKPSPDWGLTEWDESEDPRYGSTLGAAIAVLREEGPLAYPKFERSVRSKYPVSSAAVRQTLSSEQIGRWPDGRIDLRERGAAAIVEPVPRKPAGVEVEEEARRIDFTLTVDKDVLRGSGIGIHPYVVWWLGLHQAPSSLSYRLGSTELIVRRNLSGASVSSLRRVTEQLGGRSGCTLVVSLDARRSIADVRLACRDHAH